jgi:hypothetical protein
VFISEDVDRGDPSFLTGRFSAHWQTGDRTPHDFMDGPRGVPAEQAIAWGRDRADVVRIRVGEDGFYYSAGRRQPSAEELPKWPKVGMRLGRRRRPSVAYLDRKENDPPLLWEVRVEGVLPPGVDLQSFAERFRAGLEDDERVPKQVPHRGGSTAARTVRPSRSFT